MPSTRLASFQEQTKGLMLDMLNSTMEKERYEEWSTCVQYGLFCGMDGLLLKPLNILGGILVPKLSICRRENEGAFSESLCIHMRKVAWLIPHYFQHLIPNSWGLNLNLKFDATEVTDTLQDRKISSLLRQFSS